MHTYTQAPHWKRHFSLIHLFPIVTRSAIVSVYDIREWQYLQML